MEVLTTQLNSSSWYQMFELSEDIVNYYWDRISESKIDTRHRASACVGKVLEVDDIDNVFIEKIFTPIFLTCNEQYLHIIERTVKKIYDGNEPVELNPYMRSLQVNYQYKGEYNPIHWHTGLFSFVIWMKIPYDVEKERSLYPNATSSQASFGFVYNDDMGIGLEHINPKENYCCIFPAHLSHFVYPFYTSDEERISITGNIGVKIN